MSTRNRLAPIVSTFHKHETMCVSFNSYIPGAASGTGTANPSRAREVTHGSCEDSYWSISSFLFIALTIIVFVF